MKRLLLLIWLACPMQMVWAQPLLPLSSIRDSILSNHPSLKMLGASYKAMVAEAEGAYAWMAPEFSAGFFQTPYNVDRWRARDGMTGMGMFMG